MKSVIKRQIKKRNIIWGIKVLMRLMKKLEQGKQ